jgi:hypothetical protein
MARLGRQPSHGFGDDGPLPPAPNVALNRHGRSRKPPGKLAIAWAVVWMLVLFGIGIGWFVTSAVELPYRAGWSGTPGDAWGVHCELVGTGKDASVDCSAVFTSTDGAIFAPYVAIEGHTRFAGPGSYPARLHSDGRTVSVVGAKTVLFTLAAMVGALMPIVLIGCVGYYGASSYVRRRLGLPVRPDRRKLRATLLAVAVTGVTALALVIAGAAVSA